MSATSAIITMILGGLIIAISAVFFQGAQDGLDQIETFRQAAGGLGGFVIAVSDSLGATNIEEVHERLILIRGFSIGGMAVGAGIILFAVFYRGKDSKNQG